MFRRFQPSVAGVRVQFSWGWLLLVLALAGVTISITLPSDVSGVERRIWLIAIAIVGFGALLALAIHELGHIVVARTGRNRVISVAPPLVGALPDTQYEAETPRQEVRVALAGPLASVLTGLLVGGLWWGLTVFSTNAVVGAVGIVATVNLGLAVLSLMPGYPFDGSRVLRAFLWHITGDLIAATRFVGLYGYLLVLGGLAGGVLLISVGGDYALWGAWVLVGTWMVNRSVSGGANHVFWTEHSKRLRIDDVFVGGGRRVNATATIDEAIEQMLEAYGEGPMLVVDGNEAIGLVDLSCIRAVPRSLWTERMVADVKRPIESYPRVNEEASLRDLVELLPAGSPNVVLIERRGRVVAAANRDVVNRRLQEYLAAERLEQLRRRA
jgi:Zn-dependent protease